MNHKFHSSALDITKCGTCKMLEIAHGDNAVCECCNNVGPVELVYGNMLMCPSCIERDKAVDAERMKPENVQARVDAMRQDLESRVKQARDIDNSIQIREDLFNANTVAIVSLKAAIDNDETIVNKPFALAEELMNRLTKSKAAIFELNEKIVAEGNLQKAIQVYVNGLANQLRIEEREKLHIQDINYKPTAVKVSKPKTISTTSKKFQQAELTKYAMELSKEFGKPVTEFMLQGVVISKGVTVEVAANLTRNILKGLQ